MGSERGLDLCLFERFRGGVALDGPQPPQFRQGLVRARPGLGTFVTRVPSGPDPATQAGFLASMTDWLRSARGAGLGPDDIEAIYRTAFRTCFAEGVA